MECEAGLPELAQVCTCACVYMCVCVSHQNMFAMSLPLSASTWSSSSCERVYQSEHTDVALPVSRQACVLGHVNDMPWTRVFPTMQHVRLRSRTLCGVEHTLVQVIHVWTGVWVSGVAWGQVCVGVGVILCVYVCSVCVCVS